MPFKPITWPPKEKFQACFVISRGGLHALYLGRFHRLFVDISTGLFHFASHDGIFSRAFYPALVARFS
jgi:hypothetical protein